MQKVSKQSLAMIALSILLAISIALTFTFAALSASKTATGTITFSGNVTVTYNGDATASNGAIVFAPDYVDNTVSTDNKSFVVSGEAAYVKIEIEVTEGAGVTVQVKNPFAQDSKFANIGDTKKATFVSTNTVNSTGSNATYNVDDLIKATFSPEANLTNCTITIKVSADTRQAFTA